jgi:hypothetical protein
MAKGTMGPPSCRDSFTPTGEGTIRRGRKSLSSRGDAFRLSSVPLAMVDGTSRAKSSKFWSNGTADRGKGGVAAGQERGPHSERALWIEDPASKRNADGANLVNREPRLFKC